MIGRYNEADPFGIAGGRNHLYVYTANNPTRFIDFWGLQAANGEACKDPCKEKFNKQIEDCEKQHFKPVRRMSRTYCVITGIGTGVALTVATRHPAGAVIGGLIVLFCFVVDDPTDTTIDGGVFLCKELAKKDYEACKASSP